MMNKLVRFTGFILICSCLWCISISTAADPVPLTYGRAASGSISLAGENDNFTFTGSTGDLIIGRTGSLQIQPKVNVYDPAGTLLGTYSNHYVSGVGTVSPEFLVELPSNGTYTVLVADDDGRNTGTYGVMVQRTNNVGTAVSTAYGRTVTGSIALPAELDTYTFAAQAGDLIYARLSAQFTNTNFAELRLYAPNGTPLTSPNGTNPVELSVTAPATGTYALLAGDVFGYNTGNYGVYLQRSAAPQQTVPLAFGQTVNAWINVFGEMDAYTFTGTSGDRIVGRAGSKPVSSASGSLMVTPQVRVYSPSGILLGTYDQHSNPRGVSVAPEFFFELQETGTYTVLVADDDGRNTGEYGVMVQRTNSPGAAANTSYGTSVTGSIALPAELDTYTFTAQQGDPVYARLSSQFSYANYADLRLYAPDGELLASANSSSPVEITVTAPTTGKYALLVGDTLGSYTGNYGVYVQRCAGPDRVVSLTFGQAINGSLGAIGEMDTFTFAGQAGDRVIGRAGSYVAGWWGGTMFTPRIEVFDPAGTRLGTYDVHSNSQGYEVSPEFSFQLSETGTYTVIVGDNDGQTTGDYGVMVQRTTNPGNAVNITYGASLTSAITLASEFDTYTFVARQGDPIYARLSSQFQYSNYADLRLFAPDGTLLASPNSASLVELSLTAPVTGTYVMLVGNMQGSYPGPYGLSLQRSDGSQDAIPLEYGLAVNGTISGLGEADAFTFTGQEGDWIVGRAGSEQIQPRLQVSNPGGSLVGTFDQSSTPQGIPEFFFQLPESGTYTVLVSDNDGQTTGDYGVLVQRTNNPGNAVNISYGAFVAESISGPAEFDTFAFSAEEGDSIFAQLSAQFVWWDNRGDLRLYGPDGVLLTSLTSGSILDLSMTAPATGTYVILVGEVRGVYTGTYTFEIANRRPVAMVLGQTYRAAISSSSMNTWNYYFADIPAGEDLVVQVVPVSPSARLELYAALNRDPTASSYDFVQKEKTVTGAYELLISPTAAGTYHFGVFGAEGTTEYTIRADTGDVYVSNVFPTIAIQEPEARIQLYGLGFVPGMQVRLEKNGSAAATASSIVRGSPTMIVATFDLSSVPFDTYDVVAEWPGQVTRTVPGALEVKMLPDGVLHLDKDFSISPGQTITYPIVTDNPANLFVTLQKVQYAGDPHYNWQATVTILRDGVPVATDAGNQDQIVHIPNPGPGDYTVSVTAGSEGGHGILAVAGQLPVMTPGEWVLDRVQRPYGSVFRQIDLPTGQAMLKFDAQAMGGGSHFKVFHGQWGSDQAWISSSGPEASLTIPNPPAGLYVVEFMDTQMVSGGSDQTRDVMLLASTTVSTDSPPGYVPAIASISPTKAGNTGNVTIEVKGAWLNDYSSVSLVRSGYPDITATTVTVDSTGTDLAATFDLTGGEPGAWELTVSKPDGQVVAAPFTILEGGQADVQIEIIGRNLVRFDRPSPLCINVHNAGNIDADNIVIALDVTDSGNSMISESVSSASDIGPVYLNAGTNFIKVGRVAAGQSLQVIRYYKINSNNDIYLSQSINGGQERVTRAESGPCPGFSADQVNGHYQKSMDALDGPGYISDGDKNDYRGDYDRFNYPDFYDDPPTPDEYDDQADDHNRDLYNKNRGLVNADSSNDATDVNGTSTVCESCSVAGDTRLAAPVLNEGPSGGFSSCGGGSVDPEDKYGIVGYGESSHFVKGDQPLSYRVDFWNAENATANVMDVQAYDQLDANLDRSTFGFTEVGFTNWKVPLDGAPSFDVYVDTRPEMPYIVHITGDMDPATGKVTLEYHTLDATTLRPPEDTVAGFLPPIATNEFGWFAYSVSPNPGIATGTVIENQAFVNFDFTQYFPAPPDGPWRNTLDAGAPTTGVDATLVNSTEIRFTLSGTDDAAGSGLNSFTIYGSDNGGAYAPFVSDIVGTSAVTYGAAGHTYRFFSIGRDNVGNIEAMKSAAEATVTVTNATTTPTPIPGVVTVPGGTGLPRDPDGDGRYDDVNGNGRKDFADVVLYFNQMSWIAANEPAGALDFDYNENDRIDFADVVWLFNNL